MHIVVLTKLSAYIGRVSSIVPLLGQIPDNWAKKTVKNWRRCLANVNKVWRARFAVCAAVVVGWFQRLVEGLEKKGHVVVDSTMHAVVQAIFDKCKPSSTSVGENVLPRQTSDDDDDDELCVVAVSDYRKHGAPSGF